MVHCTLRGHAGLGGYQLALVPIGTSGMTITGEWDTLGMRATVSPSVSFEDCRVSGDAVLGRPGEAIEKALAQSFSLGYAAVYLGAAQKQQLQINGAGSRSSSRHESRLVPV